MIASPADRRTGQRVIVHVDMAAFFAAVEVRERPELAGKPVIVGGSRESRRGVVATASYEARRYGVRSAMPIRRAVALCPHGIFIPARHGLYREVSEAVLAILHEFSPLVEPVSIDEAYLDMTADRARFPSLEALGRAIKERIVTAQRLTATVGIAPNKLLAKLASELSKPDGLMVIEPGDVDRVLAPLPVERLPGVGPRTGERLRRLGITTVADLRARSRSFLGSHLGRLGQVLYEFAHGIDLRPVQPRQEARSISAEQTFEHDVERADQVVARLTELCAEVGRRLRAEGWWAQAVVLKARYPDFVTVTRRTTLGRPAADDATLLETARRLLRRLPPRPGGFRLLGVGVESLTRLEQGQLWDDAGRREPDEVDRLVDAINARYRRPVVVRGRLFKSGGASRERRSGAGAGDSVPGGARG
ncbi:MAG: DNA polymerase IV [Firmicutes bacterium]|nr:DNA polymerase IV [Bacillota bacterium]